MSGYRLSPNAEADLYRIWLYGLEQWGMAAADAYHQALFERFEAIAANPKLFLAVDHIRAGYRRCSHQTDSIYYRIDAEAVEIIAILGRQDAKKWL
jgi:toxin ParE1/3/4